MKFSLITVTSRIPDPAGDIVSGHWLQNYIGTLEGARARAILYQDTNHGTDIAIVDELPSSVPFLMHWTNRKELV
jgi:hypothetical protein